MLHYISTCLACLGLKLMQRAGPLTGWAQNKIISKQRPPHHQSHKLAKLFTYGSAHHHPALPLLASLATSVIFEQITHVTYLTFIMTGQ